MPARPPEDQRATAADTPRHEKQTAAKWIQAGLFAATGAAIAFWVCHLETARAVRGLSWLCLAVVLASWPAYLAWRNVTASSRSNRVLAAYHEGYADGYLRGVSDRLTGAADAGYAEGFAQGFTEGIDEA